MDTGVYVHGDLFLEHEEFYAKLMNMAWERKYSAGEHIIEAGQMFSGFYLINSGTIESSYTNTDGKKKSLALHCARVIMGASCMDGRTSNVTYSSITPVTAAFIPKEMVEEWDSGMLLSLAQIQTHKSRNVSWQIEYAKYYPTEVQVLKILEEYELQSQNNPNCGLDLETGIKKQWVADLLSITNVRLSHIISTLERKKQICVTKMELKLNPQIKE